MSTNTLTPHESQTRPRFTADEINFAAKCLHACTINRFNKMRATRGQEIAAEWLLRKELDRLYRCPTTSYQVISYLLSHDYGTARGIAQATDNTISAVTGQLRLLELRGAVVAGYFLQGDGHKQKRFFLNRDGIQEALPTARSKYDHFLAIMADGTPRSTREISEAVNICRNTARAFAKQSKCKVIRQHPNIFYVLEPENNVLSF